MPVLRYSLERLGLLVVCAGLLWRAGMQVWLAVVVAAFLAAGIAYVALAHERDAAAAALAAHARRRSQRGLLPDRAREDAAVEDAAVDAVDLADVTGPADTVGPAGTCPGAADANRPAGPDDVRGAGPAAESQSARPSPSSRP